jgi:hypothetical protein
MSWWDLTKEVIVPGLAAFGGAWAAFCLEGLRERRRESARRYLALRVAHFVCLSQFQQMLTLSENHLKPVRHDQEAWWRLKLTGFGSAAPRLNVHELGFLLEGSDPNLLNRLTVGEMRYDTVRAAVESRSGMHVELQRQIAVAQARNQQIDNLESVAGRDLVGQLKDITSGLFGLTDDAETLISKNITDLEVVCSVLFPTRRPPKTEIVPATERD